jgi:drug/metabolite transporter (DMT)-like permease
MNPTAAARIQVVLAALLFSTGGAAIKTAVFTSAQVSAMRSGIAAVAILTFVRGRIVWTPAALLVGIVYASTLTLFVAATKLTTAANAIFLQSTAPLYLLVLGPLVLREPVRRRDVVYVCAVAVGMVFCFAGQPRATSTAPDPSTGNLVALASGVSWALTLLSLRWVERGRQGDGVGLTAVIAGNVVASIGALPFALPLPSASIADWATLVYLGVFQIGVAYLFLTAAVRRLQALDAALLLLLEPVLNPVWTWIVRGEHPGAWTIAGGAVIVCAAAAKSVYDARVPAPARTGVGHGGHGDGSHGGH